MTCSGRILAVCLTGASSAFSQEPSRPSEIDYATARCRGLPRQSVSPSRSRRRRLDEPASQLAPPVGDFVQRRPRAGEPMTERTDVRFLDDDNLYLGIVCFDSDPDRIVVNSLQNPRMACNSCCAGCGPRKAFAGSYLSRPPTRDFQLWPK